MIRSELTFPLRWLPSVLTLAIALFMLPVNAAVDSTFAQSGVLAIHRVLPNAKSGPRYGKFEITLDLSATFTNPFDPADIDVGADFSGPDGEQVHVNGFFDQEYIERGTANVPDGAPIWKIRFAPTASGAWQYRVTARDRSGSVQSAEASLDVSPSTDPGYVRVSDRNPSVFAFKGERTYFPIGEDMCWEGANGPGYADWLKKLHAAGGNWIRVWMCSWSNGIEWSPNSAGYHGLGVYNLENAWRLDHVLDEADASDVYVMLCFDTFGEFTQGGYFNEGQWKDNPYNAANGGPCTKAEDFWTSTDAQRIYQQKLRYIAARYGYRTGLQSWEFWNEYEAPAPWIAMMSQFLKGTGQYAGHPADPSRHLITTTYGNADVWKIPEVDWTESHLYGTGDIPDLAPPIAADAAANAIYRKPHLMAEFGIDYRKPDTDYDPAGRGIDLHNGIWSSAASGAAGSAMIWWWDSYVDPKNLYHEFAPLAKVASKIEWTAAPSSPLAFDPIVRKAAADAFEDLVLPARTGWGKAPSTEFHLESGYAAPSDSYTTFLYSPGKADLRTTPAFYVHFAKPGQFIVHVNQVSNSATLQVSIDGVVAQSFHLDAAPPRDGKTPDYQSTQYNDQWKIYQATFDKDYATPVPVGAHRIDVAVADGDWVSVDSYTLTGYRPSKFASASAVGVSVGREALIWVHNLDHNWKNAFDKKPDTTIQSPRTTVHGLDPGRYLVTWFDTESGSALLTAKVLATSKGMPLDIPDLTTDYAALAQRLPGK